MDACGVTSIMALPKHGSAITKSIATMSKTMYLRACEIAPTSRTWLGVGRACFILGEFDEAEDSWAVCLFLKFI